MEAPQPSERVQKAVEKINAILVEENIILVPVTTIVNGQLAQRVEVVEKPAEPEAPATPEAEVFAQEA